MFRQLKSNIIISIIVSLISAIICLGQSSIPIIDLSPLHERDGSIDVLEDRVFAERKIFASSIDSRWHTVLDDDNIDLNIFLNDLIAFKLQMGLDRMPDFARAISYHISEMLNNKDISKEDIKYFIGITDKILVIDPYSLEAHTLKSILTIRSSFAYFVPAIYYYYKGLILNFFAIDNLGTNIPSLIYFLHTGFFLSGFIVFLILLLKYFNTLKHELSEFLNINENNKGFLFIFLLIAVFWFFAGIIPVMVFFSAILFVYFHKTEKLIIGLCFITLAFSILSYDIFARYTSLSDSDTIQSLINSYSREYDPYSVMILEDYLSKREDNTTINFALANYYRRKGRIHDALSLYKSISEKKSFPELHINLGNLYFLFMENQRALDKYEKVKDDSKLKGIAYFNTALVSLDRLSFTQDTQRYFEAAKRYNPQIIDLYQTISQQHINLFVSVGLPREMLFDYIKEENPSRRREYPFFILGIPHQYLPYIGILSITFILIVNLFRIRMDQAFGCKKCGKVFCHKCSTRYFSEKICSSCHQIFFIKKGIHPKVRVEKIINIDKFKKRNILIARLLTLMTLGGGFIIFDKTLKGFLYIILFISYFLYLAGLTIIFPNYTLPFVNGFILGRYFIPFILFLLMLNNLKSMDRLAQKFHSEI